MTKAKQHILEWVIRAKLGFPKDRFCPSKEALGTDVCLALGSGALIWEKGEEMPDSVRELAAMRGVFVENVEGDGI